MRVGPAGILTKTNDNSQNGATRQEKLVMQNFSKRSYQTWFSPRPLAIARLWRKEKCTFVRSFIIQLKAVHPFDLQMSVLFLATVAGVVFPGFFSLGFLAFLKILSISLYPVYPRCLARIVESRVNALTYSQTLVNEGRRALLLADDTFSPQY